MENQGIQIKDDFLHSFTSCPASIETWRNFQSVINEKINVLINFDNNTNEIINGFNNQSAVVNELAIMVKKLLHKPMTPRKVINVPIISKLYDDLVLISKSIYVMKINLKVK